MRAPSRTEFYPTPQSVIDDILVHVMEDLLPRPRPLILEPAAGDGRILLAIRDEYEEERCPVLVGVEQHNVELYPYPILSYTNQNFLSWTTQDRFDLIITNPPFSLALPFLLRSHALLAEGGTMYYLLRLGVLSGKKRYNQLWSVHPPEHVFVLRQRPSFTGGGTDRYEYAWFRWRQGHQGPTTMSWL